MVRAFFVLAGLGLVLLGYATLIEPERLVVRQMELGEGTDSTRIVLVADIHFGGRVVDAQKGRDIVARINAQSPDIVLMPGDFVDGSLPEAERSAANRTTIADGMTTLAAIDAPIVASLGNHDSYHGQASVRQMLEGAGVTVLRNAGIRRDRLCIVGMADEDTDRPNTDGYAACEEGDTILALMHSPDSRRLIRSDTALSVAGHTHGGQVNLPLLGRAVTSTQCGKPCAYGLIQADPPLVVTAGIGTSILPIRFRSPPEVVVITLRHAPR